MLIRVDPLKGNAMMSRMIHHKLLRMKMKVAQLQNEARPVPVMITILARLQTAMVYHLDIPKQSRINTITNESVSLYVFCSFKSFILRLARDHRRVN
jgi:hypothetical protein